jgi:ABC-2 type transport system ATP-binding protein
MRGRDVLAFFADMRPGGDRRRSQQLAERLELDLSRRVALMSTGMRQKLALAATLAADAPLLILDEPTNNLDPTVRGVVMALVAEARQQGRTVLCSSHVLSEVEQMCDRVIILRDGRLVHTQIMSDLRRRLRIRAKLNGVLPEPPEDLRPGLSIQVAGDRDVTIDTSADPAPLLRWLSTAPLEQIRIEPLGLRAVYDRFHGEKAA